MNRISQPTAQETAKVQSSQEPHVARQQVRYAAAARAQAALVRQYPAMLAQQMTQSMVSTQGANGGGDDSQIA